MGKLYCCKTLSKVSLSLLATHCDWMHFHTEITKNDASLINAEAGGWQKCIFELEEKIHSVEI